MLGWQYLLALFLYFLWIIRRLTHTHIKCVTLEYTGLNIFANKCLIRVAVLRPLHLRRSTCFQCTDWRTDGTCATANRTTARAQANASNCKFESCRFACECGCGCCGNHYAGEQMVRSIRMICWCLNGRGFVCSNIVLNNRIGIVFISEM